MKKLTSILLFTLCVSQLFAQSIEELKSIQEKSKSQFNKPEDLDALMIKVRKYETNQLPDQDSLMLDIYKSVSASYLTSSHYKQGLNVFNQYLSYKENMLAKDKNAALTAAYNSINERSRNDQTELLQMQNQSKELKSDNENLTHRLVVFKSYFSLILLVLSIVFAVILVGYGIKSFSLRSRLNENRMTMKNIHRLALTGRYEQGVRNALESSIKNIQQEIETIKRQK